MKKTATLLLFVFVSCFCFSQTKAEQTDLNILKALFKRLKEYKIDTKDTLLWTYTYVDTSMIKLKQLAEAFEKTGLTFAGINSSKYDAKKYELTVSEENIYTVKTLHQRAYQLNDVAKENNLDDAQARIGGDKRKWQGDIGKYKPLGKKGNDTGKTQ